MSLQILAGIFIHLNIYKFLSLRPQYITLDPLSTHNTYDSFFIGTHPLNNSS